MVEALINIVAVIAIIAIGAFIIVVLSDLLISIIDGKNGIFFKRGNKKDELPERPKMVKHAIEEEKPEEIEQIVQPQIAYQSNVDMEEAKKEEAIANQKADEFDFSSYEEEIVMPPQQKQPVRKAENYDKYIDEITALTTEALEDEEEELDFEETVEEVVEEEVVVNQVSNEEIEKIKAELEEQRKAYEELLNAKNEAEEKNKALESEKEQLVSEKDMLQKALEEQAQSQADEQSMPAESIEELTARLAILEDRLKTNEKLLKANKKEFQPLFRIKKSLDNDTKKLRRKEASVAKQKVMLYGVNNFVDIDEEKAKQLNEELDLLEGLRLSVKHCEDVMNANKDRYPVLEQTNKILTATVADIKADIEDVKAKIDVINSQNATEEVTETTEENA